MVLAQAPLRILFTGDLSITGVFRERVRQGSEIFDRAILDLFAQHDFTVVNLEGPATTVPCVFRPDLNIVSPPETVGYLAKKGITIFNCANNHIFDCGFDGFEETTDAISAFGGQYFGAGANLSEASRPLYLAKDGVTVGLIGVCNHKTRVATPTSFGTFCDSQSEDVNRAIRKVRDRCDYVVLNYHAGEEYTTIPMPSRRRKMLEYADLGVDAIIGHHPHVMQGHERRRNCEIFYSLGNFVFDVDILKTKELTNQSALLSMTFKPDGLSFELVPIECDLEMGQVIPGPPWFLDHLERISDLSNYRSQWRRDAYRTFFQKNQSTKPAQRYAISENVHAKTPRWRRFFKPKWYLHQYRRLTEPNFRPIVLAAYYEAISRFLRRSP